MINNTVSQYFNTSGLLKPTTLKTANTTPNSTRTSGPITGAATLSPVKSATIAATATPESTQSIGSSYTPQPVVPQVPQPQPAPQPTPQTTPDNPTTFPGLVKRLATTATAGSPEAQDYTRRAVEYGAGSIPIGQQARDIAQQFGQKYADIGQAGARFQAGQLTTGTTPVAEGNAAITAQTTAAQQTALAQGQQAALQGLGYELTGQQQAAGAAQAGANAALTGQGQAISGLGTAAGLAQPNVAAYGQTVFDPLTGEYTGGGGNLNPQTQATSLAQQVMSGQITYAQALASIGYAGSAGTNFLNQAITSAGGNPLQLEASGGAQQQVIGSQAQQIAGYQSALQQGQNLQSQLTDLITTFGLNPNDVNAVNIGLQKIAQNTSSPQYKILSNYVNDIANTYSQVLTPPGGSATDTTRSIAASMLDATAKGTSLIATMKSLDQAAQAKIAGVSTTGVTQHPTNSSNVRTGIVQTSAGAINTDW